jgi:hypothetical protein
MSLYKKGILCKTYKMKPSSYNINYNRNFDLDEFLKKEEK